MKMTGWKVVVARAADKPRCPICNASQNYVERISDAFEPEKRVYLCNVCESVLMKLYEEES